MNFLKSLFISNFLMLSMAAIGFAGWMLYQGENPVAWIGVLLATGPSVIVIGSWMMFKNVARTSTHFPFINFLGIVGIGLSVWIWVEQSTLILPPTLALAGWLGFLLYAYWYSNLSRQPSTTLKVGAALPDFNLKDVDGQMVSSAQLTETPAILIFYRGNWCPLCIAQIKEIVDQYHKIENMGVRIALISPQPHSYTIALSKKFDVNFDFLADEGNAAARTLGIDTQNGLPMGMQMLGYDSETVLPTVIITDENGKVIWTHETDNYRVRPEPDVFLEVLRRHNIGQAGA